MACDICISLGGESPSASSVSVSVSLDSASYKICTDLSPSDEGPGMSDSEMSDIVSDVSDVSNVSGKITGATSYAEVTKECTLA